MQIKRIEELFEANESTNLKWSGECHDCKCDVTILIRMRDEQLEIEGGAVYEPEGDQKFFLKCMSCFEKKPKLTNFREAEVYSRVVGYLRPVKQWNPGKEAEFGDRQMFKSVEGLE